MRIKEITSQNRRDFYAIYVCEHCDIEVKGYGYDDDNFHRNVIPKMKCKHCGKSAGDDYIPHQPKYESWERV
jgi:ribosomal protein L37AE/L43A